MNVAGVDIVGEVQISGFDWLTDPKYVFSSVPRGDVESSGASNADAEVAARCRSVLATHLGVWSLALLSAVLKLP